MKWCQSCKCEYEDYVKHCADCGANLISEEAYKQANTMPMMAHRDEPLELTAVYESTLDSEVLIVSSMLEEHGIYSEIKNTGIGSYLQIYSGTNYLGTSVCVNQKDAEEATALIKDLWGDSNMTQHDFVKETQLEIADESDLNAYSDKREKSLSWMRNFLKVFILLSFGSALIINLISIFAHI